MCATSTNQDEHIMVNVHARLGEKTVFIKEEAWKKLKDVALSYDIGLVALLSAVVNTSDLAAVAETLSPTFPLGL